MAIAVAHQVNKETSKKLLNEDHRLYTKYFRDAMACYQIFLRYN